MADGRDKHRVLQVFERCDLALRRGALRLLIPRAGAMGVDPMVRLPGYECSVGFNCL